MSESFGILLRRFRTRAELNVSELAEAVGASRTSIVEWEQDKRVPRDRARLEDLAQVLQLSAAQAAELVAAARQHRQLVSAGASSEAPTPPEEVSGPSAPIAPSPRHALFTAARPTSALARRLTSGDQEHPVGHHNGAQPADDRDPDRLTRREIEVLRLLAHGIKDAEIAEQLIHYLCTFNC